MATVILVGTGNNSSANESKDYCMYSPYVAVATGSMTEFRAEAGVNGNVKVALYADNAGNPGTLITAMNTGQAVVSGWNTLSFTATPITTGVTYWLAIIGDVDGACHYYSSVTTRRYKAVAYAGFSFPSTAAYDGSDSNREEVAGWGELGAYLPPRGYYPHILAH